MAYRVVPGKLKLKPTAASAAAPLPLAGAKRPRQVTAAAAVPAPESALDAAAAAPVVLAPPQRVAGSGTIITSGTTVHGAGTKFMAEIKVGDALEVSHPHSQRDEVRVVKMVLSDTSCGINAPFSADLVAGTSFNVLRLPKLAVDPAAVKASAEALRRDEELKTSVFATDGGTKLSYHVRHGLSYKTVTESLEGGPRTREEILDLRAKKKSDKYC